MGGMPEPLDPLELALLLEATEDVGLGGDETPPAHEADDDDEDDQEP
jgi:hypothetical protein